MVNVKASTGNLGGDEGRRARAGHRRALAVADRAGGDAGVTIRLPTRCPATRARWSRCSEGHVRIYSCGPTVYGPVHIGNFRSFLFADLLVRYLRAVGLRVTWVMNVTDIDDKIIRGAAAAGIGIEALAERWLERVPPRTRRPFG